MCPHRWTDYEAVGKRIPGTRFIAFKVPLKQVTDLLTHTYTPTYSPLHSSRCLCADLMTLISLFQALRRHLSESEVFGPFDLIDVLKKEGEELGLIIDLTYTTRYYQPQVTDTMSTAACPEPDCSWVHSLYQDYYICRLDRRQQQVCYVLRWTAPLFVVNSVCFVRCACHTVSRKHIGKPVSDTE